MPRAHTKRMPVPHGTKNTPERRQLFLDQLKIGNTPALACKNSDIGYTTVHEWRRQDPAFDAAWAEAVEEGVDLLEQEARRRAFEGVKRPIFSRLTGEEVGHEVVYSDTLMTVLLKGRRKKVFADRVEQTGPEGGPMQHEIEVTFVKSKEAKK